MARRPVLGDTLSSISIYDEAIKGLDSGQGILNVKIGDIEPNRGQPRKDFDPEKLNALAESISQHGLIQPLTVRELDGGGYQIVAGERRWRAARIAGLAEVPVRVMELSDSQTMQIALIENLQREDLNPIEEAAGYKELTDSYGMTQDEVAKVVGKARSSVTNALRLLTLPDEIIGLLRDNALSKGHCKAIMAADSTERMVELANRAASGELSVREVEKLARQTPVKAKKAAVLKKTFFTETEIALSETLRTNVKIIAGSKKNTLCIDFADEEELKNIVKEFKLQ